MRYSPSPNTRRFRHMQPEWLLKTELAAAESLFHLACTAVKNVLNRYA